MPARKPAAMRCFLPIFTNHIYIYMALLEKQLYVRRSTLKGAGMGLFTSKPIAKGTKIVEYKGRITTWKEVDDRNGLNGYIYYVNRNHVIDAWTYKAALARYANDAMGPIRARGVDAGASSAVTASPQGVRRPLVVRARPPYHDLLMTVRG